MIGQTISHYRIMEELGRGGMGVVYKADDTILHRTVAIKVLPADLTLDAERRRLFLNEARLAGSVSHGNIVQVHELGREGDLDFIVMEYIEGQPLTKLLHGRPMPPEKVAEIGLQVAEGLVRAHRKGLIHRDLKPANILVTRDGDVKIVDFGLAMLYPRLDTTMDAATRTLASTGSESANREIAGTLPYMSPEQVRGEKLDARSDIFSLGSVLYEMTTGQRPFTGLTPSEVADGIQKSQPRPLHDLVPRVPLDLHRVIGKALARRPVDRYQHVDDLAVDLRHLHKDLESGASLPFETSMLKAPATRRRLRVVAASATGLIALGLVAWQLRSSQLRRAGPELAKKAWVLVPDFDGPAGDSLLVVATRDLVIAALEQSEIVATVPGEQIRVALQMAGKPSSTRVDADLGRELAVRSAVRTVLEGRVGRLGRGYSLVLRLVDADSATVVLSVSDTAKDDEDLIPTVDRLSKKLRKEMGERRSAILAARELANVTTPSFEAYKTFLRGRGLLFDREDRAAITMYRSALTLDPDFASAWSGIGWSFGNLGEPDSALAAFRHALARPDRLTQLQELFVTAQVAYLSGDISGALTAAKQLVQLCPERPTAHNNLSAYLSGAGRHDEALESCRAAERVSPFGPNQQVLGNMFWCLLNLGQVDTARGLIPKLRGSLASSAPMWVAAAAEQWSAAESLAAVLLSNPIASSDSRVDARQVLASCEASRGQVAAADQLLRQMQSEAKASGETFDANRARQARLLLALFSRGVAVVPEAPGQWDSTTVGLVTRGQWAAAAGDTSLARELLATIRTRSGPDVARLGFMPTVLQAWIAARSGRWEEVQRDLGSAAQQGEAKGYVLIQSAPLVRWLVAEAYEQLDRPDSAAAYFERAIAPPPIGGSASNGADNRMASSFGHWRLALLYSKIGRVEEAKRHWEIFEKTFTNPDSELVPMIEEARQALEEG